MVPPNIRKAIINYASIISFNKYFEEYIPIWYDKTTGGRYGHLITSKDVDKLSILDNALESIKLNLYIDNDMSYVIKRMDSIQTMSLEHMHWSTLYFLLRKKYQYPNSPIWKYNNFIL